MKVLIGCETSGVVRRAFEAKGHDVWSCDILPAVDRSNRHIVCDIRELLSDGWDMLAVMHPPCTRLCNSGVRWLSVPPPGRTLDDMWTELDEGAALFSECWNAPIERVAIENPIMHRHAKARIRNYQQPAQTVQPWHFGDPAFKATSFYLRGLPPLVSTNRLNPPQTGTDAHKCWSKVHRHSGWGKHGLSRAQARSVTYPGMADAMAAQWGGYALKVAA
jgi:hypothetical protein